MNRVLKAKRQDLFWDWSANPITGCSIRCSYCWAAKLCHRFPAIHGGGPFTTPRFHSDRMTHKDLRQPKDGQRVFLVIVGDMLCHGVKREWVLKIIEAVKTRPGVHFLVLTKAPENYNLFEWPPNVWLGTSVDTWRETLQRATALNCVKSYNIKWLNAAPALSPPPDELWGKLKPNWLVAEPLHGFSNARLENSEANVHAWHRWADRHQVPIWIKGMKHWDVQYPIPKELPILRSRQ